MLLDGHDLRDYRLEALRRQISLVSQEITLFNTTIAANIAYGASGPVSEAELIEVARAAHAWEFIAQLPQGLQTQVGQHGVLLSGGQRQRLAIARALANEPTLLLADEPTGALDSEGGLEVLELFRRLHAEGQTIVMVTHSADVAAGAQRVVRMRDGRIVAGTD